MRKTQSHTDAAVISGTLALAFAVLGATYGSAPQAADGAEKPAATAEDAPSGKPVIDRENCTVTVPYDSDSALVYDFRASAVRYETDGLAPKADSFASFRDNPAAVRHIRAQGASMPECLENARF